MRCDGRGRRALRVGVDARHLAGGRGVAHYTSELLGALTRGFPADEWRAFAPGRAPLAHPAGDATPVRHRLPSRLLFGATAIARRPRLDRLAGGDLDVVWIPAPAPAAVSPAVPYVLTVHDLSWIERPQDFTRYERAWHRLGRLQRLAERARAVVAVSEATRDAVATHWPRVRDVRVIRSGIPSLPPPAPRPPWLPERYFLAVGALEPRKAPAELKAAFAEARRRGLDADLVFAGRGRLARALEGEGVHVVEDADRATIATLYDHAVALALPSRLEGFGFTALEAARAGLPVLTTSLPSIAETLGDAALTVEGSWADALLEVAGDSALRDRLGAAAQRAAQGFTWTHAANEMHAVLQEAAR